MSMTTSAAPTGWAVDPDLWRCVACGGGLGESGGGLACEGCGRRYPIRDGVLVVKEELEANNRVVRDFYDGPLWPKFRFWEWLTFVCNGGERRARNKVLRHLPQQAGLRLLDVAIGDGVYLDWLPRDWRVVGIDISPAQLAACRRRAGDRELPLALGEAEQLPFRDHRFDAVLSIGGFNYFNDPEGALREMARVVRPGGTIVISDEVPDLTDRMLGHKLGLRPLMALERRFVARWMHLGDAFTDLVERHRDLDVAAIARRVLPDCRYERIWQGVGYVLVGQTDESPDKHAGPRDAAAAEAEGRAPL
jgi:ubiquinone/menaquinone biosynthesis C-methylase UbiE